MAKSKNHTNHNKSRKDHKNGIDKPKRCKFPNRLGVCQKFKLNLRYSRKHQVSPAQQQKRFQAREKLRQLRAHKVVAQPPSMK